MEHKMDMEPLAPAQQESMLKKHMLSDDQLEAVAGGGSLYCRGTWGEPCSKYVCKMCGSTSKYLNAHHSGCSVPGFGRPASTAEATCNLATAYLEGQNGCWSCKHALFGDGYPHDPKDVWCPILCQDA